MLRLFVLFFLCNSLYYNYGGFSLISPLFQLCPRFCMIFWIPLLSLFLNNMVSLFLVYLCALI